MRQTASDRFWGKVDRSGSGCWLWRGSKSSGGYGTFWFLLTRGHPGQLSVLHHCDERRAAGYANGSHTHPASRARGEANGRSTLKEATVREIKIMLSSGKTRRSIAGYFGIHHSTVDHIADGRSWKWVTQ